MGFLYSCIKQRYHILRSKSSSPTPVMSRDWIKQSSVFSPGLIKVVMPHKNQMFPFEASTTDHICKQIILI